jgi:alpha-amylase/alpha-mannosidase (GH57 family)
MTRVALLWHMHQPFYQDLATGEHILPWVRLHALKDYWGMVALLRDYPAVRVTFNLVPSMLVQLEAFARDEARDRHLEIGLKPADRLTPEERAFCLDHFFHAQRPRMVDAHPRYAELLAWRDSGGGQRRARAAEFSTQDFLDLQVWHKLVWIDAWYHERDGRVAALLQKGRFFDEDDKRVLRNVELELLRRVIPEYREAAGRGQVELSTSPFYHPILPLLCDTDVYRRMHPDARMPRRRFAHPEDAAEQLARAVAYHESLFGTRPDGVWPSEGSVSDDMVPLAAAAGFRWMATDEEILARTLGRSLARDGSGPVDRPDTLYRPYRLGEPGRDIACAFRDHELSDLIGFTYASWEPDAAAEDFVRRLVEAGRETQGRERGGDEPTVFVILDGENAWEHYEGQGRPFLRALYGRLETHPELRTVCMREACAGAVQRLPSIAPGSWIHGDFYIWIGHPDDHRAWDQLADARRALERAPDTLPAASRAAAREELLVAEGSDWFWWYGDDHSSEHDVEFDELFRRHVQNVYRALDQPIPDDLFVTNITTRPPEVAIQAPTGFIEPVLDGEITSYFEWVGAGCVDVTGADGAMHKVAEEPPGVTAIEFGFDMQRLYLRIDARHSMRQVLVPGTSVRVNFVRPEGARVTVEAGADGRAQVTVVRRLGGRIETVACAGAQAALGKVLEIAVPFSCLGLAAEAPVGLLVAVHRNGAELSRHPRLRPIEFSVPDRQFVSAHWTA